MIRLEGLTRKFDGVTAVEDLTMTISDGEVFGFIGPNGAGKTTTIRMLCCLIKPTNGTAFINENEIGRDPDSMYIRQIIGLLPEAPGLYERLSARRNLDFYAQLHGLSKEKREERIEKLLRKLNVWDRRDDPVATFSKGMKQKIAIARALVHEPEILFLDEPTAGLDPQAAKKVREFIFELKEEGGTIFLNTHNLAEAERLCGRIGVINTRLLAIGSPDELSKKFWGRTTVLQLRKVDQGMLNLLSKLDEVLAVRREGNVLEIDVTDPEKTNPRIARTVIEHGGEIKYMTELKHHLEDIYMKLIGGS